MMNPLRARTFLRSYFLLPHHLLNAGFARLMRARRPQWLVQRLIREWIRRARIDMGEFQQRPYATVEEFFLRRLRDGARPLGEGLISPVDGTLVARGPIEGQGDRTLLCVKGERLSLMRLVNGKEPGLSLDAFHGGSYVVIFLSPRGYHRIHMPLAGTIAHVQQVPGRFFPQNQDALRYIAKVYERNERAAVLCRSEDGPEYLLVLVGASLVGGIQIEPWIVAGQPRPLEKGQEIARFSFGSTVVLVLPPSMPLSALPEIGCEVRMGQTLAQPPG